MVVLILRLKLNIFNVIQDLEKASYQSRVIQKV